MYFNYEILLRLLFAAILGGTIGLERGRTKHEAGLRTHILVSLGAATVMALSDIITRENNIPQEILRMGAQVVSGVGFLGAGSIMFDSNKIRGVTTAAGIWTTACVGLVAGSGYYLISLTITAIILFAMIVLRPITRKISSSSVTRTLTAVTDNEKRISELIKIIADKGMEITKIKYDKEDELTKAELLVTLPDGLIINDLLCAASECVGIKEFNVI